MIYFIWLYILPVTLINLKKNMGIAFIHCYLISIIFSLFMSFKTYTFGQINKSILLFQIYFAKLNAH